MTDKSLKGKPNQQNMVQHMWGIAILSAVICKRLHCDKGNLRQHSARIREKSDISFPSSPNQCANETTSSKISLFFFFLPETFKHLCQVCRVHSEGGHF